MCNNLFKFPNVCSLVDIVINIYSIWFSQPNILGQAIKPESTAAPLRVGCVSNDLWETW